MNKENRQPNEVTKPPPSSGLNKPSTVAQNQPASASPFRAISTGQAQQPLQQPPIRKPAAGNQQQFSPRLINSVSQVPPRQQQQQQQQQQQPQPHQHHQQPQQQQQQQQQPMMDNFEQFRNFMQVMEQKFAESIQEAEVLENTKLLPLIYERDMLTQQVNHLTAEVLQLQEILNNAQTFVNQNGFIDGGERSSSNNNNNVDSGEMYSRQQRQPSIGMGLGANNTNHNNNHGMTNFLPSDSFGPSTTTTTGLGSDNRPHSDSFQFQSHPDTAPGKTPGNSNAIPNPIKATNITNNGDNKALVDAIDLTKSTPVENKQKSISSPLPATKPQSTEKVTDTKTTDSKSK